MKKIQIGVIGSMADFKLKDSLKEIAKEIGKEIVKSDAILIFGFEGDFESLSSIAAKAAEDAGGQTLAFTWGLNKDLGNLKSIEVVTGQQRGGGREFSLVLSCDCLICISGGSGTLMEMLMAYQANIPIIAIKNSGGWSEKLLNKFIDNRKRLKVISAISAKEAVMLAIKEANRLTK
jgi:uncharacterized protein (TIGR00725 family)